MKKQHSFFLVTVLFFLLCGCSQNAAVPTTATTAPTAQTQPVQILASFDYAELKYTDFLFSSGAGAWGTQLYIEADGTFSGTYHDTEMGDTGQGYESGTVYYCDFYGQFGEPVPVDDHTYRLPIQVLRYGHVPDSQKIIDGQRYCYTTAMGIDGTTSLLLYLPGAPLASLPEEYRQWVQLHTEDSGTLPFWGLYNETQQCGFSSSDRIENAKTAILTAEEVEASINSLLDEYSTQADMNVAAHQRYIVWDDTLNTLWGVLRQTLPGDELSLLTQRQLEWIGEKERSAEESAAPFEGGSLYPTVYYSALADLTKERVYVLVDSLPRQTSRSNIPYS